MSNKINERVTNPNQQNLFEEYNKIYDQLEARNLEFMVLAEKYNRLLEHYRDLMSREIIEGQQSFFDDNKPIDGQIDINDIVPKRHK